MSHNQDGSSTPSARGGHGHPAHIYHAGPPYDYQQPILYHSPPPSQPFPLAALDGSASTSAPPASGGPPQVVSRGAVPSPTHGDVYPGLAGDFTTQHRPLEIRPRAHAGGGRGKRTSGAAPHHAVAAVDRALQARPGAPPAPSPPASRASPPRRGGRGGAVLCGMGGHLGARPAGGPFELAGDDDIDLDPPRDPRIYGNSAYHHPQRPYDADLTMDLEPVTVRLSDSMEVHGGSPQASDDEYAGDGRDTGRGPPTARPTDAGSRADEAPASSHGTRRQSSSTSYATLPPGASQGQRRGRRRRHLGTSTPPPPDSIFALPRSQREGQQRPPAEPASPQLASVGDMFDVGTVPNISI